MKLRPSKVTTLLAGAALAALAPQARAADFMLSDFETGGQTNALFGYWFFYNDVPNEGNSRVVTSDTATGAFDFTSIGPGHAGSQGSGQMGFVFGDKAPSCGKDCVYDPEVGMGTDLRVAPDTVANLTGATAITFWAKANKPIKIKFAVNLATVTDFAHYYQTFDVGADWKQFTVQLKASAAFAQPNWGKPVPWNPAAVQTINWVATKALNKTMTSDTLLVDDVQVLGWDPFAMGVLAERTPQGARLRLTRNAEGLTFNLPQAMRASGGILKVLDMTGREAARASYSKGQASVEFPSRELGHSGPLFIRAIPGNGDNADNGPHR